MAVTLKSKFTRKVLGHPCYGNGRGSDAACQIDREQQAGRAVEGEGEQAGKGGEGKPGSTGPAPLAIPQSLPVVGSKSIETPWLKPYAQPDRRFQGPGRGIELMQRRGGSTRAGDGEQFLLRLCVSSGSHLEQGSEN